MTKAKFVLIKITQNSYSPQQRSLTFEPRYDETIPEDQRYLNATPSGTLEMVVDNPAVLAEMQIGKAYYLTLEKA